MIRLTVAYCAYERIDTALIGTRERDDQSSDENITLKMNSCRYLQVSAFSLLGALLAFNLRYAEGQVMRGGIDPKFCVLIAWPPSWKLQGPLIESRVRPRNTQAGASFCRRPTEPP